MKLEHMKKTTARGKKRVGKGHGSGRGKTAGRGTKGQKARRKMPLYFEGGALPLIKRLPFRRGKGRNKSFKKKPVTINVKVLNILPKGSVVDIKTLIEKHIVEEKDAAVYGVKILGEGQLFKSLKVSLPVSGGAKEKIEKAGGTIIV